MFDNHAPTPISTTINKSGISNIQEKIASLLIDLLSWKKNNITHPIINDTNAIHKRYGSSILYTGRIVFAIVFDVDVTMFISPDIDCVVEKSPLIAESKSDKLQPDIVKSAIALPS